MIDSVSALSAQFGAAKVGSDVRLTSGAAAPAAATSQLSFGEVLAQISGDAVESVRGAEAASISGLRGQASVMQVVDAIKSAEQALQTAITIRDKVVSAYQEISRMAI